MSENLVFVNELPKVQGRGRKSAITPDIVRQLIAAGQNNGYCKVASFDDRTKAMSRVASVKHATPDNYKAEVSALTVSDKGDPLVINVYARYVAATPDEVTPDEVTPDPIPATPAPRRRNRKS